MAMRRLLWGAITGLAILALARSGVIASLLLHPARPQPRLLVGDTRVRQIDMNGSEHMLADGLSTADFTFPAISPDGHLLVYSTGNASAGRLVQLNLATGQQRELYHSNDGPAPFDLAWSPDGHYVTFLANSDNGFFTYIVPADGSQPAHEIASSQGSFFAWRPDSSALLLHLDNTL